jgi:hypothetical protein
MEGKGARENVREEWRRLIEGKWRVVLVSRHFLHHIIDLNK